MNSWDLKALNLKRGCRRSSPQAKWHAPSCSTSRRARASRTIRSRAAWLVVLGGEIQLATAEGERTSGGVGLLVEFAPEERHEVVASADARLLLLLTPWPGSGHPGAMTIREKLYARRHAAKQAK